MPFSVYGGLENAICLCMRVSKITFLCMGVSKMPYFVYGGLENAVFAIWGPGKYHFFVYRGLENALLCSYMEFC